MAAEATTETWLYAGHRTNDGKTVSHVWVDPEGKELFFKKLPGSMPGHAYQIELTRGEEGRVTVHGSPRYLGSSADRQATDVQLETWRGEHAAANGRIESNRAEKNAGADDELQQALEVLRRHHNRLRGYVKKGAFQAYVLGEMQRPPNGEKETY